MKRVEFISLHAENFKVYRDFTFDFASFGAGCHSIRGRNNVQPRLGSNGVGKSSLWDGLCFALYGKTTKRLRAADVQPYGTRANPALALRLAVDDVRYIIRRTAVPHTLSLNGETCNQERIDNLVGIGIDLFLHTVLLAQGCPLFLDLEPRFKLGLLSDVLSLERFDTYSKRASDAVAMLEREKLKHVMRSESVCGAIAEVGRELNNVRRLAEQFKVAQQDEIRTTADQRRNTEMLLREAEQEVASLNATHAELTRDMHTARENLMRAEAKRDLGIAMQRDIARLKIGDPCPTCRQPIDHRAVEGLNKQAAHVIAYSKHSVARSRYDTVKGKLERHQLDMAQATKVERTTREAYSLIELTLRHAEQRENPYTEARHKLKERLAELGRDERAIAKEIDATETLIALVTPWPSAFRDMRLIVLDDLLASLSVLTTSYANELGLACNVRFSVDRPTKSGSIVTGVHMSVDAVERFEAWSGGEAQRLRLAASLALAASLLTEAGVSVNLLALDEPSAHLSPEGLNELTTFLSTHAEAEARSIFLTDQRPLRVDSSVLLTREADNVLLSRLPTDDRIDTSDIPEVGEEWFKKAKWKRLRPADT